MKAYQLLKSLCEICGCQVKNTCDTVKAGCPEKEVRKAAVCFIATREVIEAAVRAGADVLITHEPTYYNHPDEIREDGQSQDKAQLVAASGLTVMRLHDHMHRATPDLIHKGFMEALELSYEMPEKGFAELKEAITPAELALRIKQKLGLRFVRLAGNADFEARSLFLSLGECPTELACESLQQQKAEIVIAGEVSEWRVCEYVRDAAQFGRHMAVLALGHEGSERDGMKYLTKLLAEKHPELEFVYLESEEVYRYI